MKQRDHSDCGAACLAWLAARHGLRVPLARIRQAAGTNRAGTTAAGLIEAATTLGFTAKGVKGPVEALPQVPLPAIAHCVIGGRLHHFVVLVAWSNRGARVMDPASGRVESWPRDRFLAAWSGVLVVLAPTAALQRGDHTVGPWRRLWELLSPHRAALVQALCGAAVATVLGLAPAFFVQQIVDQVLPDGNRPLLNLLAVGLLAVVAARLALSAGQALLTLHAAQRIDALLILGYYRHLLRLPQTFFDGMRVGEITSRVGDALRIRHFLSQTLPGLVLNPLIVLCSLGCLCLWSWPLALLSLALVPAHAALYAAMNHLNRRHQRAIMEFGAALDAQLVESLQAQPLLRAFQLESGAVLRSEHRLVRLLRAARHSALAGIGLGAAGTALTQVYAVALLWLGASLVLDARLTPGELMSCHAVAGYLTAPLTALLGLNASVQDAVIATDRLFEIIDLQPEPDPGLIEFTAAQIAPIRFEHVSYRPPGRAAAVVAVDFVARPGRLTVLCGPSGCGKTTILALLQRWHAPTGGRIWIGDRDLSYFNLPSWRRHLAVVAQQPQLLSGTILENLAADDGAPDVPRLLSLCRDAGMLSFIEQLPRGFLTILPENGSTLSGGQRQRLALIRALYRQSPILLLDEPTSAFDPAGEAEMLRLLRGECDRGRIVIVASHAPALLAAADDLVALGPTGGPELCAPLSRA